MFSGADIKRNLWHRSKNCWKTFKFRVARTMNLTTRKLSKGVRAMRGGVGRSLKFQAYSVLSLVQLAP